MKDLLGEVEWFLVLETETQDFVIGKIDGAVCMNIQFIPPPALSFFQIQLHLEFVFWRPYARFK